MDCKVIIPRNFVKSKAVLCYKTLKENQTHGYIYEICDWDENLIFARTFLFKISWFLIRGCPTHGSSFFYILLFSDLKASLIFCGCLFQLPPWIIWDDVGLCNQKDWGRTAIQGDKKVRMIFEVALWSNTSQRSMLRWSRVSQSRRLGQTVIQGDKV